MGKKNAKAEEKKVRASDFSNFHTADSRPTGLHQIFASFNNIARPESKIPSRQEQAAPTKPERPADDAHPELLESQGDILALLNKLTKKDSVTKLKALETFNELAESTHERVLEDFVVDVIHLFKKSAVVEPTKKIRLEYGLLLGKIASKLKRRLQQYLESFITHWWIAMHDENVEIAEAYAEAFRNLFSTAPSEDEFEAKTLKILSFYFPRIAADYLELLSRDQEAYAKEWLDTFGKSSQSSASMADMHNRLFHSILHSLRRLFVLARAHARESPQLDALVNAEFVARAAEIARSASFKKKLPCVLMMVEMVKVLPERERHLLERLLAGAIACVKMETEPALIYHNVRLICACTREDSRSIAGFLPSYEDVVVAALTNFDGEAGNKVDLFTLFPSLYMYLDAAYFEQHRAGFERVLAFLADLMRREVEALRRTAYTFDLALFRNLGTCMLCSFYKLLLIARLKAPEHVTLPVRRLLPVRENARDFLWNYPAVLTEYVSELGLLGEACFPQLMLEFLALSSEATVLVAATLDSLFDKYGPRLEEACPGLGREHAQLLEEVAARLPGQLEEHLEHRADLSLDIEQAVQLLRRNALLLPHSIPALLFKSDSHAEFLEDYRLLLQVYRSINSPRLAEALSEQLDPRLTLFYAVVLLHEHPERVEPVFSMKFDLREDFTSFLAGEFVDCCRGLALSNELVQFAGLHLDLELIGHLVKAVEPAELTGENRRRYETMVLAYELYKGELVDHGLGCDSELAERVLTPYLCQVLKERLPEFGDFSAFVLSEWDGQTGLEEGTAHSQLERLDAMHASGLDDSEAFSKRLASLLTGLFNPDFIVDVLVRSVGLVKTAEPSALYRRSYHLAVGAYLKWEGEQVDADKFLDVFVSILAGSDQGICAPAHDDLLAVVSKYELDEKQVSRRLMLKMLERLMARSYESTRRLNDSLKVFQYFYGVLRAHLGGEELAEFIKSHFALNLTSGYFLSSLYTVSTPPDEAISAELERFGAYVAGLEEERGPERLEERAALSFVNHTTTATQLLLNYKNCNGLQKLRPEDLAALYPNQREAEDTQGGGPEAEESAQPGGAFSGKPAEGPWHGSNLEALPLRVLKQFTRIHLPDLLEFSWAHISLFNFLSLFSVEFGADSKNDHHTVVSECLETLYGCLALHAVSGHLLAALLNFEADSGLASDLSLRVDAELEHLFEAVNGADCDLARAFASLSLTGLPEPRSLAYRLAVCLKVGAQALELGDAELQADLASSVCLLLQHAHQLRPGALYASTYAAPLWECRAFYPAISDSGFFCNFPNHENPVVIRTFPDSDFFHELNGCTLDLFKLLYSFNNYSDAEEPAEGGDEQERGAGDELSAEELEGAESRPEEGSPDPAPGPEPPQPSVEDARNAYDLMKLYFAAVVGPYLAGQIMRTYRYLDTGDTHEIEKCLISWLTVFSLHARYKRLGNVNCANALVKLLTSKPQEVGEYMGDALQENLAEALEERGEAQDMSFIYSDAFGLARGYPEEYYAQGMHAVSLLDQFLQLLILCLEKMLIRDERFCGTVKLLYYRAAKTFPTQVAEMWSGCRNAYVKKNIKKFTKHEVTQKLVREELETLRALTDDLSVFYDATKKEVTARLQTKNEITARISIRVPSAFPLEPLTFVSNEARKNHRWIMFSHSEANRSGIAQGLMLWYNNVVRYYEGIDECPICYSIVHTQFQSVPTKACKVCKYKFHKECLFKWFRNAAKAKCPLCQSQVSFL